MPGPSARRRSRPGSKAPGCQVSLPGPLGVTPEQPLEGFGAERLDSCSFRPRFVRLQDQINETWDFLDSAAIVPAAIW